MIVDRDLRAAFPPDLPGADLVARGIAALERREFTVEALLVAVGAPRLRAAGLPLPDAADEPDFPELALYEALRAEADGGAHSRYLALIRRLVSFERALETTLRRKSRQPDWSPDLVEELRAARRNSADRRALSAMLQAIHANRRSKGPPPLR